jgi:hypothetical protein
MFSNLDVGRHTARIDEPVKRRAVGRVPKPKAPFHNLQENTYSPIRSVNRATLPP